MQSILTGLQPTIRECIRSSAQWLEEVIHHIVSYSSADALANFAGNADGTVSAVFGHIAFLTPFAMTDPSQFRPGPPYAATLAEALASAQYAEDLKEVKAIGRVDSTIRTSCGFW